MKKNDESVNEEEVQKTITTLISLNRLEERGIGTKSYFIPSLSDNILAPQTQIMDEDEPNFSEMENPIIDKENNISDCNWTRTHNHLVHKRTLNHLAKLTSLAKWPVWLNG